MTITWRADASVTTGLVQAQEGDALANGARKVVASVSEFITDLGKSRLFTAKLTGLKPGTRYSYRVGDGEVWSPAHTFTTADPTAGKVKFLALGDSQSVAGGRSPYSTWRTTLHNAFRANSDARFVVMTGDLVDVGQSAAHWNGWFAAAAGVIDAIPIMPALGNHETMGSWDTSRPIYWNAQFRLPQNGPNKLKNQVYSWDYGPVHFAVLDSQMGEQKLRRGLAIQRDWLDADLAASSATWKIVLLHKPPYSLVRGRDNAHIRRAFGQVWEKHGVDLVMSGHDHAVSRTSPIDGVVYYVIGRSGTKTYRNATRHKCSAFFQNPLAQPNYMAIEVTAATLTIKTVKCDGSVIDEFVMAKPVRSVQSGKIRRAA